MRRIGSQTKATKTVNPVLEFRVPHPFHVPVGSVDEIIRFVKGLHHKSLPERVDAAYLQAHGLRHEGNLDALQFLGLVTKEEKPTGLLMLVVSKNGQPVWKKEFWQRVVWAYGPCFFGMDPSFCTEGELRVHFQAHMMFHEDYANEAVRFYLNLRTALGPRDFASPVVSSAVAKPEAREPEQGAEDMVQFRVPLPNNRQALVSMPKGFRMQDVDIVVGAVEVLRQMLDNVQDENIRQLEIVM